MSRRKTTRFFSSLPVSAWPKSLLQFDFKNHENMWTDLKKRQRPNTIQILWIVKKNQEKANNSPSYRCAAINKNQRLRKSHIWTKDFKQLHLKAFNLIPLIFQIVLDRGNWKGLKTAKNVHQ